MKVVIATTNQGKFKQYKELFKELNTEIELLSLTDINYTKEVIENADTFEGNSLLKATQVCKDTGLITIADDSGLCVDALNGAPGVYTARYAGKNATKLESLNLLLNNMVNLKNEERTAHFVCVITCLCPNSKKIVSRGECHGHIANEIMNINEGITYDPIFIPNVYNKTLSMFSAEERVQINHRGIATRKFIKEFKKLL
ncbi:MAG: RdgB/HAM1 family non-canonical purine NTP pyrophosphatase [Clostridia bacterium]|nr:RdgB/HAM1 family non-canonical purine NTP pyrophosphatase [Clostridia bacterium]